MNNPDHISESLEIIFWLKYLKFFDADQRSGMGKIRIRSGINIRIRNTGYEDYVVSSCSDMKSLLKNKSFVLSTIAFTCVTYCAGAMMWWGPNFAFAGAPAFTSFALG
jgi:hypothetical protein